MYCFVSAQKSNSATNIDKKELKNFGGDFGTFVPPPSPLKILEGTIPPAPPPPYFAALAHTHARAHTHQSAYEYMLGYELTCVCACYCA